MGGGRFSISLPRQFKVRYDPLYSARVFILRSPLSQHISSFLFLTFLAVSLFNRLSPVCLF